MPGKLIPKSCAHCGAAYFCKPSRAQRNKYCSRPCANVAKVTDTAQRFWSKVDVRGPDDCWLWLGGTDRDGYGYFDVAHNDRTRSHRVAFKIANGAIDPKLQVQHSCDNPPCNNPGHLTQGTTQENSRQMVERGRSLKGDHHNLRVHPEWRATGDRTGARTHPERVTRGQAHYRSKLTETQVLEIRERYRPRIVSTNQLASEYGVSQGTIWAIVHGKTWTHI